MLKSQLSLLRLTLILAVFAAIAVTQAQTASPTPANPNANATTRAILNYAYGLTNRTDNRVISGQFGSYGDGTTYNTALQQMQAVYNLTGQWPALTGMDCATPAGMNEVVRYLTDMWNAGNLVTLSCHFRNPWTGGSATNWGNPDTADQWDRRSVLALTVPGTTVYNNWISMLDNIAANLQILEDRGVTVMWRPLHELNGTWFWWGGQSPSDFTALWRHMFDYFTRVKGLDNLLWVYSPNSGMNATANYPGGDVVDMVGLDEYSSVNENPLQINSAGEYDQLVNTGKPIGLFEFGPIPATGASWDTTTYSWANLIRDIKARYPRIFLVQAWEYVWQMGYSRYQGQSAFMSDPWVITRSDLPRWSGVPTTVPVTATTLAPTTIATSTPIRTATTGVPTSTIPPTAQITVAAPGARVTNGVQALYTFGEGSGTAVRDTSGAGTAINLNITYAANTRWLPGGGLEIIRPTNITSGSAPARLYNSLMASDAVSLEAWVKPANTTMSGTRIFSMSNDTSRRNLSLVQFGTQFEGRMRTSTGTDGNGTQFMSPANIATTNLQHIVITHSADGVTKLYVNGVVQTTATLAGTLDNWNTVLYLNIGNNLTGEGTWLGELHLVALYNRALTQAEVAQNLAAGIHGQYINGPLPPTAVPTTVVPTNTPTLNPTTAVPTSTPTLIPTTAVPTSLPTLVPPTVVPPTIVPPTTTPGTPQNGTLLESDNPSVTRSVGWVSVNAANASGSSYLINTRANDNLTTTFAGVGVEIVYVSGSFGTFGVEIDGQVVRTITTTATDGEVYFNARARIDGLANAPHTLRILPSSSAVAIDAIMPLVLNGGTTGAPQALIAGSGSEIQPMAVAAEPTAVIDTANLPVGSAAPLSLVAGNYESDHVSVIKTAGWSLVNSGSFSGGTALMSSDPADSLTVMFEGSAISVLYAGTVNTSELALEIDGQIVQQINTNNAAGTFGQALGVDGLTPSIHTLRVLPLNGTSIIVDAFVIGALVQQSAPVIDTSVPADPAAIVPTAEPTLAPAEPVVPAAPMAPVTSGALGTDNMEAGTANWMTAGGWQLVHDDANAAIGYFWQTVTPDGSSDTLTWLIPFDFSAVQRPTLTFQSWLQAPNSLGWIEASVDGINWQQITTVSPSDTWTNISIDLSGFVGQPRVNVRFLWQQGSSAEGAINVWHVDNVSLNAQ